MLSLSAQIFSSLVMAFLPLASAEKNPYDIGYPDICQEALVELQDKAREADLNTDGYGLLKSQMTDKEVARLIQNIRNLHIDAEEEGNWQVDLNSKEDLGTSMASFRRFVNEVIAEIEVKVKPEERPLSLEGVQVRYAWPSFKAPCPRKVWMHPDGGYIGVTCTWRNYPTFLEDSSGEIFPAPAGVPLVFSAEERSERYRDIESTWHGQPKGYSGERLLTVIRLVPAFYKNFVKNFAHVRLGMDMNEVHSTLGNPVEWSIAEKRDEPSRMVYKLYEEDRVHFKLYELIYSPTLKGRGLVSAREIQK